MRSGKVDFTLVLSMFFDTRLGGKCLIMCHVGAVLGLSWEDLGPLGCTLGASCATSGQSWENLGATWFNLGRHSECEVGMLISHWFYRCFSTPAWVAEVSSCAMSGLSWGYLGRIWGPLGPPWGHLVPRWGNLGRTWRLLGSTWGDIANAK